jgi:glc operon protein GlcG
MTGPEFALAVSSVSIAGAEAAVAAARAEADRRGVAVTIAVLDRGGYLQLLTRMDGIHVGTVAVAIAKAKAAVLYNRPTAGFGAALAAGNLAPLSLPDVVAYPGGLPLLVNGRLVGSIGVSGAAPEVDNAIAEAGEAAFRQGIGGA